MGEEVKREAKNAADEMLEDIAAGGGPRSGGKEDHVAGEGRRLWRGGGPTGKYEAKAEGGKRPVGHYLKLHGKSQQNGKIISSIRSGTDDDDDDDQDSGKHGGKKESKSQDEEDRPSKEAGK